MHVVAWMYWVISRYIMQPMLVHHKFSKLDAYLDFTRRKRRQRGVFCKYLAVYLVT